SISLWRSLSSHLMSFFLSSLLFFLSFFLLYSRPTPIHPLSLHDALPILRRKRSTTMPRPVSRPAASASSVRGRKPTALTTRSHRSEEHTSELQSRENLVCRLLLEKQKRNLLRREKVMSNSGYRYDITTTI